MLRLQWPDCIHLSKGEIKTAGIVIWYRVIVIVNVTMSASRDRVSVEGVPIGLLRTCLNYGHHILLVPTLTGGALPVSGG